MRGRKKEKTEFLGRQVGRQRRLGRNLRTRRPTQRGNRRREARTPGAATSEYALNCNDMGTFSL